ncbi:MAG: hypothetical protein ABFC77_00800 [Thermoguttaceae bacterium]
MPRITRIAGSLAVVLVAYWVYWLVVVPWVEPPAGSHAVEPMTGSNSDEGDIDPGLNSLKGILPPEVLDPKKTKVLAFDDDRAKLLFQEYQTLSDGAVTFRPCTIVFGSDAPGDEAQRRRQSIILEARSAWLKFDKPLSFNQAKIGRLTGGRLDGPVTIRSDWKEPGPEDDLWIDTQDVRLVGQVVTTPNPVNFRWGPHYGRGRNLRIKLLSGPAGSGDAVGMNIVGVETFELGQVEQLHLDLGETMASNGAKPGGRATSIPVEINCRGPFRFDVVNRVATFHDNVGVMIKEDPNGPAHQIDCDRLSLYFARRNDAVKTPGSMELTPERLEACGNPVVVTAPGRNLTARAERIQYYLQLKAILLEGGQEVFLQQGLDEIHARSLYYQMGADGRMGRATSQGPGRLTARSPDRPDQSLVATWKDQLRIDRDGQDPRISLTGGAQLESPGFGQLQADGIFLWLSETSPPGPNRRFQWWPSRLGARGNVHVNSPQMASKKIEELQVWFQQRAEGVGPGLYSGAGQGGAGAQPATSPRTPVAQPSPQNQAALSRFEISGRLVRVQMAIGRKQASLSDLTIEDGVELIETQTAQPGQQPICLRGDRLEASNLSETTGTATVSGRPAHVGGRGLGLSGADIRLDIGANRLWIDGPGRMDVLLRQRGEPPSTDPTDPAGLLTVDWRRDMEFDGARAQFNKAVVASARQVRFDANTAEIQLNTDTLEVRLQEPIHFGRTASSVAPLVETLSCGGGVLVESRSFDPRQQLTSHDWMQLTDLGVNLLSGELNGGAGWLNSVYRGSANPLNGSVSVAPASSSGGNPDQLYNMRVKFEKSVTGNVLQRALKFEDRVVVTYAPVNDWDAMLMTEDPDKLGRDGVVVHCDQLDVSHIVPPLGGRRSIELAATGNAVAESSVYTARAQRITYEEAKDLLVLDGDGRNPAELFQQTQPGVPPEHVVMQKILYWRKTGQVKSVGVQSLQGAQPSGGVRTR